MSVRLIIGSQVINFPTNGTDASWGYAVVQFAQAVTDQLSSIASAFDVSPRVQTLTSDANSAIALSGCTFPSGSVRSFNFSYAIYRTNTVTVLAEEGTVSGVYNTDSAIWTLQHEFQGERQSDGSPYHTFSMSGDDLRFTSVAIGGSYDNVNSKISFGAKTVLVSDT